MALDLSGKWRGSGCALLFLGACQGSLWRSIFPVCVEGRGGGWSFPVCVEGRGWRWMFPVGVEGIYCIEEASGVIQNFARKLYKTRTFWSKP